MTTTTMRTDDTHSEDEPVEEEETPADLSVQAQPPPSAGGATNTRLLREILQNKKQLNDEDVSAGWDMTVDSPASVFLGDEDEEELSDRGSSRAGDVVTATTAGGGGVIRRAGGGNLTVELESGGRLKQQQSRVESLVLGMAPRVPSSNAASSEHSDGPGGSLGSTESSSGSRRKTKRKQVYPKQQQTGEEEDAGGELDSERGDDGERKQGHQSPSSREKDVMRKEFSMMREKIDVLEERYVSFLFDW